MHYREQFTFEPRKHGGKPCIRGLRITVYDGLNWLASGMTAQQIIENYPEPQPEVLPRALPTRQIVNIGL
jgi:uncharacterized protein (DUF433 family)